MIENIIGFLWGIVCTIITIDAIYGVFNIHWMIWAMLVGFIAITTAIGKAYLFITDYKALAETGLSVSKKVLSLVRSKTKKDM